MKYITEDYETGTAIDEFNTYAAALEAIAEYESNDKDEGAYSDGFYAIRHGDNVERIYRAEDSLEQSKRLIHSRMGKSTSIRKAASSRANGKKGGRPKKNG